MAAPVAPALRDAMLASIPSAPDVPGTVRYHVGKVVADGTGALVDMAATRKDRALFMVALMVRPDAADAGRTFDSQIVGALGKLPSGVPSRRKIGRRVASTPLGRPPRGAFAVIAADGRCVVSAQVMLAGTVRVNGRPLEPLLAAADIRAVEDLALKTLSRMARYGYTATPSRPR